MADPVTIEIPAPDLRPLTLTIVGRTPLLCSNGEAAVPQLEQHQKGDAAKKTGPKVARVPDVDYQASFYRINGNGTYGFPGTGIAKAIRTAGTRLGTKQGTVISAAIRITSADFIPIEGSDPYMHKAYVRHGGRVPDLAYRACFPTWQMDVPLVYNAGVINEETVVQLFVLAGFAIGIGAWRPEKNGTYGQFTVKEGKA